ncbi:hypothetical protein WJX81_003432 [Elliptochloris bilobata]|uniref:Uncharacterized protein n=1 Tax=Elliptochloris bilobata TaxID=381761 RepID=A0AAW1S4I8_9CHLO
MEAAATSTKAETQKLLYVAPTALDEHGKAVFGVPGPGHYQPATSFNGHSDAGRQVFPAAPAFTAGARLLAPHKLHLAHQFDCLVPRWTSPGPAAYAPVPAAHRSALPFGWSKREGDPRLYAVAGAVAERFGDCSPGPARYDVRGLCARAATATAAAVIGGGALQRLPPARSESPHGPYGAPDTMGEAAPSTFVLGPPAVFAPRGPRALSAARDRHEEGLKVYLGPGLDLPGAFLEDRARQPGPGEYGAPVSAVQARAPKEPVYSFTTGDRGLEPPPVPAMLREPAMETLGEEAVASSLQPHPATVFAPPPQRALPWQAAAETGSRGWQCRLEVALAWGPWAMLRAPGPGPAAYDVRERFAEGALGAKFGSASRALTLQDVASACHKVGIPGPGAYHAAESAVIQAPSAPAYPFGLRACPPQAASPDETPGPGAYSDGANVRWPFQPGVRIVRDGTHRSTYVPRCDSPGPVYLPLTPRRATRGVNMGRRASALRATPAHAARASWFPSAGGGREVLLGHDSPGPGYDVVGLACKVGSALARRRCSSSLGTFGRPTRRLMDAPASQGPPQDPLAGTSLRGPAGGALPGGSEAAARNPPGSCSGAGRFCRAGAFSFGTSQRSQILNVRF